jgi:hypothetical protein
MRSAATLVVALAAGLFAPVVPQADAGCHCQQDAVRLIGPVGKRRAELSGIALIDGEHKFLAVSNSTFDEHDRDTMLQIYEGSPADGYTRTEDVTLFKPADGQCEDADFEGLTRSGEFYFVIGSHSRDRKKQDKTVSYDENRARLTAAGVEYCSARNQIRRFRLNDQGQPWDFKDSDLMPLLIRDPVLAPFAAILSKENGIDIEGIAATDGALYVGFKGPVLRQNYVPILHLDHDFNPIQSPDSGSPLLFVNLDGRGVRDMTKGPGNKIYILAGPNGNEDQSFAIYRWSGDDQIGGRDHAPKGLDELCELGHFNPSGKPEGIAYIDTVDGKERFLLVYDGDTLQAELVTIEPSN